MDLTIRAYQEPDLPAMTAIWNEIVEEGAAFPQVECLDQESGEAFFPHRAIPAWRWTGKPGSFWASISSTPTT